MDYKEEKLPSSHTFCSCYGPPTSRTTQGVVFWQHWSRSQSPMVTFMMLKSIAPPVKEKLEKTIHTWYSCTQRAQSLSLLSIDSYPIQQHILCSYIIIRNAPPSETLTASDRHNYTKFSGSTGNHFQSDAYAYMSRARTLGNRRAWLVLSRSLVSYWVCSYIAQSAFQRQPRSCSHWGWKRPAIGQALLRRTW